jgi:hypothetical protein
MNANTAEGARETALYFLQLFPYMMRSGDTTEWDRLSVTKECKFCSGNRADAVAARRGHRTYSGGLISAKVVTTYDRDTLYNGYPIDVEVTQQAYTFRDAAGKTVNSKPMTSGILSLEVVRSGKGWKILGATSKAAN